MISTNRATPFKIHDENGGKAIKALKSSSKGLGDSSVLKTGQKSQRKALSSISNNQLNARALSGLKDKSEKAVIKDSKPMVHFSLDTPLHKEKEEAPIDTSEMLVSGPYIKSWDEVPDEYDRHVFEQEKQQMMHDSMLERAMDAHRENTELWQRYESETRGIDVSIDPASLTLTDELFFHFPEDSMEETTETSFYKEHTTTG